MTIRVMSHEDLQMVLGWAGDEGWNPGLDDAIAFFAADPAGFLLKEVDGDPAAAISVVNHDPDFAFLGLYLCKLQYRGRGHGMDVWRAGIAHAGTRRIGLDGVPDQEANYARSGFVKFGSTLRYEGMHPVEPDPRVRRARLSEIATLVMQDVNATGINRRAFATEWFSDAPTRNTMVLLRDAEIKGFATFRRCGHGIKVGPLHAATVADARALLGSNPFATSDEPVYVDVPAQDSSLGNLLEAKGFAPVFETARMFRGDPPKSDPPEYYAIATMELG